jgi:ATP-dependent Lhr-like helicase
MPGAVEALRRTRKQERTGEIVRLNGVDPLNLVGILTPGPRLPAIPTNAVIYRDGLVVATEEGGRKVIRAEGGEEALRSANGRRRGVA